MAQVRLQQTDTTAPCSFAAYCSTQGNSGGTTIASDARVGGTAGTTEVTPAMVNNETRLNLVVFSTPDLGITDWTAGDYVVRFDVASQTTRLTWEDTYVCRVNSSCTNQETIGSLTSQATALSSVGVVSHTISGSSTTAAATDRLVFVLAFSNNHEHGGDDPVGYIPSQLIDTPFDDGFAQGWLPAIARRRYYTPKLRL